MRTKIFAALALVAAVAGGWYYAAPLWTLKAMRDAAQSKDGATLVRYIDFETLRSDLKGEMTAVLAADMQKPATSAMASGNNPLGGATGAALAGVFAAQAIDMFVNPTAVQKMVEQGKGVESLGAMAGASIAAKGGSVSAPKVASLDDVTITRGFSEFRVTPKPDSQTKATASLVFRRNGLGWKLAGIDIPPQP